MLSCNETASFAYSQWTKSKAAEIRIFHNILAKSYMQKWLAAPLRASAWITDATDDNTRTFEFKEYD
jgi:hypothetical protein